MESDRKVRPCHANLVLTISNIYLLHFRIDTVLPMVFPIHDFLPSKVNNKYEYQNTSSGLENFTTKICVWSMNEHLAN